MKTHDVSATIAVANQYLKPDYMHHHMNDKVNLQSLHASSMYANEFDDNLKCHTGKSQCKAVNILLVAKRSD